MPKTRANPRPKGASAPPPRAVPARVRAPRRDGQTELRILDAAHAVFTRQGTAGARMQEIAKAAKVNAALLHYYFTSKEHLAEAVFRRAAGRLFPSVIAVLGSELPLEEKVARVVDVELDHLSRSPYLPAYLIGELAHHPARMRQLLTVVAGGAPDDLLARVRETLRRQLAAAARARTMKAIDPDQFLVNLLALCIFPFAAKPLLMVLLGLDERRFDAFIDRRRVELPRFFLGALGP